MNSFRRALVALSIVAFAVLGGSGLGSMVERASAAATSAKAGKAKKKARSNARRARGNAQRARGRLANGNGNGNSGNGNGNGGPNGTPGNGNPGNANPGNGSAPGESPGNSPAAGQSPGSSPGQSDENSSVSTCSHPELAWLEEAVAELGEQAKEFHRLYLEAIEAGDKTEARMAYQAWQASLREYFEALKLLRAGCHYLE